MLEERRRLADARRVVVKVGTRVLVDARGRPHVGRMRNLVNDIAELRRTGRDVILVSSGAIGSGMEALGLKERPDDLPGLQMAAAVGQARLMARYAQLFARHDYVIGQMLLTHEDLKNRARHLNARNTLMALLRAGVVPVVNENDVVSVDEIRFSDNDHLASLVTILADGDLLILLTSVDGVQAVPEGARKKKRISYLSEVNDRVFSWVWPEQQGLSRGGMGLKLTSAETAAINGVPVVIADGRKTRIINRIVSEGEDTGTLIRSSPREQKQLSSRKRWIAFFHRVEGTVTVDDGATKALRDKGKSLLPIGIKTVEGNFERGAVVNVKDTRGQLIARGLVDYASADLEKIKGSASQEIIRVLGGKPYDEAIHRDNIVILAENEG